ncbi:MAG TPA: lamin tail domain-containing protein, partial [Anaerolineales bacterium]|nr:lamin tail domain-containing protein [Anaerolineales bacterium]
MNKLLNKVFSFVVILALMLMAAPIQSVQAAVPTELFISEYIEGSSFNKAVEIYNGTGGSVNLSTYTLELYSNGASSPSQSVALSGTLADGDVFVLAHGTADAAILAVADLISSSVINFNGDDALVLKNGGAVVDSFGQVGVDPGSQWPGGGQDDTLRRSDTVCAGDTNPTDAFDASVEWVTFAQNTFDGLGAHTANCSGPGTPVIVINEIMQNPSAVADSAGEWFELYNAGGSAVDINGWTIADNDIDSHVINNGGPLLIPAGGYLVLGNNTDTGTNGGAPVDYSYGGSWFLSNGADEVV